MIRGSALRRDLAPLFTRLLSSLGLRENARSRPRRTDPVVHHTVAVCICRSSSSPPRRWSFGGTTSGQVNHRWVLREILDFHPHSSLTTFADIDRASSSVRGSPLGRRHALCVDAQNHSRF